MAGTQQQTRDVIDLILEDHDEVRELFGQIEETAPEDMEGLFRHIVSELARHEAAEEAVIHPTLEEEAAAGETIASEVVSEEQQAEKIMAEMEEMDPKSTEFLERFRQLRDDVLDHAEHEETEEHPRLRDNVSQERLREMAAGWENIKSMAPTHPHPSTGNEPTTQLTVGPIAGIFDRARDVAREALGR